MSGGRKDETRAQLLAETDEMRREFVARDSRGDIGRSDALSRPTSFARSGSIQP